MINNTKCYYCSSKTIKNPLADNKYMFCDKCKVDVLYSKEFDIIYLNYMSYYKGTTNNYIKYNIIEGKCLLIYSNYHELICKTIKLERIPTPDNYNDIIKLMVFI